MPNNLGPSKIVDKLQAQINETAVQKDQKKISAEGIKPVKRTTKGGLPVFEWMADPYELGEELKKIENKEKRAKCVTDVPFVPTMVIKKGKPFF